ncbi:hypothetical protein MLD38_035125 [Melastoma candidum]|uniref:Uncharacterized protein n=1 Tax=Melastoma candidum TaxID=119954 RepID=A0ACB9MDY2_9MYRT|nr:hypothetical protein MLD38_035125 [Melastoma candidum]
MDVTEVSLLHHVCIVLIMLWSLSHFNYTHPLFYLLSLFYLYLVHDRHVMRLKKKTRFEEMRNSYQTRVLNDSETVRWLNYALEKLWPICFERIASQKFLLPVAPWFLDKYKPWTVSKATLQHLYLGKKPPLITDIRIIHQSNGDDHLVLQLGANFVSADDISAVFAVKLRKALGFGMWTRLNMTSMQTEGKVRIGMKFIPTWPFIGRLRLCYVEPPYFQMTLKPLSTFGLDFAEFPGVSGWLDKFMSTVFEETLVEPNMLVIDIEKLVAPKQGDITPEECWHSGDVKETIAYAKLEIIEASELRPCGPNGSADPYVKGALGSYKFKSRVRKKTLSPKWGEVFCIPVCSWESPTLLSLQVHDKDCYLDDFLGRCAININDLRGGQRHDRWVPLQNTITGKLHLGITVLETTVQGEPRHFTEDAEDEGSIERPPILEEIYESVTIQGRHQTAVWIHHPGKEPSEGWEPRKTKPRQPDAHREPVPVDNVQETREGKHGKNPIWRGLGRLNRAFRRSTREFRPSTSEEEVSPSDYNNCSGKHSQEDPLFGVGASDEKSVNIKKEKLNDAANGIIRKNDNVNRIFPKKAPRRSQDEMSSSMVPTESTFSGTVSRSPPLYISKVEAVTLS